MSTGENSPVALNDSRLVQEAALGLGSRTNFLKDQLLPQPGMGVRKHSFGRIDGVDVSRTPVGTSVSAQSDISSEIETLVNLEGRAAVKANLRQQAQLYRGSYAENIAASLVPAVAKDMDRQIVDRLGWRVPASQSRIAI